MNIPPPLLLLLLLLLPLLTVQALPHASLPHTTRMGFPCANTCRLFLCSGSLRDPTIRANGSPNMLRANAMPMGGVLCSSRRLVRDVTFGEARVSPLRSGIDYVPISSYRPSGLSNPYSTSYFDVYNGAHGEQRIMRRRGKGNQYSLLNDVCVTIPITRYRLTRRDGRVTALIRSDTPQDCISMRVSASRLQFQLSWNTTDDFDLKVIEPSGIRLSINRKKSPSGGRYHKDNGTNRCAFGRMSGEMTRETVSYGVDAPVVNGRYDVIVRKFVSCEISDATFVLRVVVDGVVVRTRQGVARKERSGQKFFYTFNNLL